MRRWLSVVALLVVSSSSASAAPGWAGTISMKMSGPRGGAGTMTMQVSDAGALVSMDMPTPMGPMTQKTLMLMSKPDTLYMIDDANKSYSELDLKEMKARAAAMGVRPEEKYTVKKLGTETVAGLPCAHVLATSADGRSMELWTTKELIDGNAYTRLMGQRGPVQGGLMAALAAQGADGFVAKMKHDTPEGPMTMEVVKVDKAAPPSSLFAIPAGYAKQDAAIPGMPAGLPPEARKQIMDQMKGMTPEQQEMMKKAMGGH